MIKNIFFIWVFFLCPLYCFSGFDLSITNRPDSVISKINEVFKPLEESKGTWTWGGASSYTLSLIDEYKLLSGLILKNAQQKEFYFLDIGAGDFTLAKTLCQRLNADDKISSEVTVHYISTRAEPNEEPERSITGKCRLYNFGKFKAEDIRSQLIERGLFLDNQIDVVISAMTFRHLVDPVGTLRETYTLLRPDTGILIVDGFFFGFTGYEDLSQPDASFILYDALKAMGANVMIEGANPQHASYGFAIMKPKGGSQKLPLHYNEQVSAKHKKLIFDIEPSIKIDRERERTGQLMGDQEVYDFLEHIKAWADRKGDRFPLNKI